MQNDIQKRLKLSQSWKQREDYTHGLAGTPIHNTWRAMMFTIKGKKVGVSEAWHKFNDFANDMLPTYKEGLRIYRLDKSKPFSKENCIWAEKEFLTNHRLSTLEYNGEIKTLREWCLIYSLNYTGVRQRYFKGKNYTSHQILFGKPKRKKRDLLTIQELNYQQIRAKASKMLSSYKNKDKKKNLTFDLETNWFIENILTKFCIYCGTDKNVGADRLDNSKGHTKENVVPCCFRCNATRNNNFTHEEMLLIGNFIKNNIDNKRQI